MEVFWAQGYETTSTGDLVEATGLVRQSIYNTFGIKHDFYLETLTHYQDLLDASSTHRTLKKGFSGYLRLLSTRP